MNWFDSWALTLTVLIPAVGAAVLLLLPRAEEDAIKLVALLATLATFAATVAIGFRFKYDHGSGLQFDVNKHWIDVINSHYHVGRRRHLAADAVAVGVHHPLVRDLFVEPLPRSLQPEGVPRARAHP